MIRKVRNGQRQPDHDQDHAQSAPQIEVGSHADFLERRPSTSQPPTTISTTLPINSRVGVELSSLVVAACPGPLPATMGMAMVVEVEPPDATGTLSLVGVSGMAGVAVDVVSIVAAAVADAVAVVAVPVTGVAVAALPVAVAVRVGGTGVTVEPVGGVTGTGVLVRPGCGLGVLVTGGWVAGRGVRHGTVPGTHVVCNCGCSRCDAQTAGSVRLASATNATSNKLPHMAWRVKRIVFLQSDGRL